MHTLILGGARSGKSRLAEKLARESRRNVTLIATATAGDAEMEARIERHRQDRKDHQDRWRVVEEPLALAAALQHHATSQGLLLVDCLTLWLTNLLHCPDPARIETETEALINALPALPGELILVSNETGLGIMPLGELTRRYVDHAGRLHQRLAQCCERVLLVVAGLPLPLKETPCPPLG